MENPRSACGTGAAGELWGPEPEARSCELLTLCTPKGPGSCGQAKDLDTHRHGAKGPQTLLSLDCDRIKAQGFLC